MNFNQLSYWPGLIALFVVFVLVLVILEKKFFSMVKTYWFYNRSIFSIISSFLFILGMGGLLLSLLDLRGPEERIKTEVPTDRTIILIDTSASMLAEDVKPSRLQKAALVAKHFARKAVGQQLSIVAFAEIQKKIVPFTTDLDLIDARLDSLKMLRNQYGSSALSMAVQESVQYFREVGGGEAQGNILVLTDGEETSEGIKLNVPKTVHVAFVGIGTERGGRIPLDDSRGFRFGYKKDKGKDITTRLNEDFFKKSVAQVSSGKYWLANSYSLPSEEILEFFRKEKEKGKNLQDMIIKPVLMEWVVVPALVLIVLSYLFKFLRIFSLGLFLIVVPVQAQETTQPELSVKTLQKLEMLQQGKLNQLEKIKLADELREEGSKEEALSLYEENLPLDVIDPSIPTGAYLNYGTSLLEKGEGQKGIEIYDRILKSAKNEDEISEAKEVIDQNIVSYFKKQEEKKKEQEKNKEKNKESQGKNQENKDSKDQKQKGSDKQDKENKKGDSGKQEDKDKKDSNDGDGEKDENDKKDSEEKEGKNERNDGEKDKKPMKKIPAKLKQLMSDDRQLQMKMIENGTRDLNKRKSRKSKDW